MIICTHESDGVINLLGWTKIDIVDGDGNAVNTSRLAMTMGTVHSSVAMGSAQCNIVEAFALRRERTPQAGGLCYTTEAGAAFAGWSATINANFSMQLPFTATIGRDFTTLRDSRHVSEAPKVERAMPITAWLRRNFLIGKS